MRELEQITHNAWHGQRTICTGSTRLFGNCDEEALTARAEHRRVRIVRRATYRYGATRAEMDRAMQQAQQMMEAASARVAGSHHTTDKQKQEECSMVNCHKVHKVFTHENPMRQSDSV